MSEDLQPTIVSVPDSYPHQTNSPVQYLPVTLDGVLLGYLWAAVTDDAAGFVTRDTAGAPAHNGGVAWALRLRRSKAEGLTPLQAFQYWAGQPSDSADRHPTGAVDPGAEAQRMESLDALEELAAADGAAPMSPEIAANLKQYTAKITGCLVGGAIGDALGYPVEFDSLDIIRRRFGEGGVTGFVPYGDRSGLVSDDTQMTLFTCEGLITAAVADNNVYSNFAGLRPGNAWADPTPHIYRSYLRWLKTQGSDGSPASAPSWLARQEWLYASRAPGNACTSGLAFGAMGTRDKPKNPDSKGCGTVMRAAPHGLYISKTSEQVFEEAIDSAVLTHGHPSGYLAAGALAAIIRAVREDAPLENGVHDALLLLRHHPGHEEVTAALKAAREAAAAGPPSPEIVESLGGGWTAEEALAIAVYAALAYPAPEQTREALLLSVNHSGDSDSTGAICGNIIGAWHGMDALPADLAAAVEGRATIDQVATDLAWINWPQWRRLFPEVLTDITASYPDGDDPGHSDTYPGRTHAAVRYLPVDLGELHLGYLWASTANDAASFISLENENIQARKACLTWLERLRQSKAEGKTPLQALRYWTFEPVDPVAGGVPSGTEAREISSLAELRKLAQPEDDLLSPRVQAELALYKDRVKACLLGGAAGDSLGYEADSGRTAQVAASTQTTLFTCEGLITTAIVGDVAYAEDGRIREDQSWADPTPHVYRSYLRWLETQRAAEPARPAPSALCVMPWLYERRGPDDACVSGLSSPGMGTRAAPKNPESKGWGTVVRAAPFGLHPRKTAAGIFKEAVDASVLTHGHPSSYLTAAAFALIIRHLISQDSLQEAVRRALRELERHPGHEETTAALTAACEAAASAAPSPETVETLGGGWTAEEALSIAVYAALSHPAPEQGRDALLLSVNHSGNSAGTGAICGNIIGAWHGTAAIPDNLVRGLEGYSSIKWTASDLAMVTSPRWHDQGSFERVVEIVDDYPIE